MGPYLPEPEFRHDAEPKIGVVLVNLGTPDAPDAPALRRYLREFLWDPRVVEIPRALWWPILHGIILNRRPRQSAEKYAKIWLPEGSPLRVHTERQAKLLKGWLGHHGHTGLIVEHAMRYGEPAIVAVLERLKAARCQRILVLPLYPQYAASTTGSVLDEIARITRVWRHVPEIRCPTGFHDEPGYIRALERSVRDHWERRGQSDMLVMSFHGVPRFSLERGDPYHCQCQKTARLLAEALALPPEKYRVTFQSRFGRAQWLQPYTQPTLEQLAREGLRRVDVICPGFVSDCLETLEEIALEVKAAYLSNGGREFHYIACLNERAEWIDSLGRFAVSNLGDWLARDRAAGGDAAARLARALALGAAR